MVCIITAFCYLGIGEQLNSESLLYQNTAKELLNSENALKRLEAQYNELPPQRVSKRQEIENLISQERKHQLEFSNKLEGLKLEKPSETKRSGPFIIRLGLCIAMMVYVKF